ncbi:hypothetical protein GmHk_16G046924 [Glycine max]|nr:hypothetical protein GmHk_16G046924 [Glycine max]
MTDTIYWITFTIRRTHTGFSNAISPSAIECDPQSRTYRERLDIFTYKSLTLAITNGSHNRLLIFSFPSLPTQHKSKLRLSQFVNKQSVAHLTISDQDKSYWHILGVPKLRATRTVFVKIKDINEKRKRNQNSFHLHG